MARLGYGWTRNFSFTDYDIIGFDLDNTLCRYNLAELLKLEYKVLSSYIIKKNAFPHEFLQLEYEDFDDFVIKGLFLDLHKGNILRITPCGKIQQASHGTRQLLDEELLKEYPMKHWVLADKFTVSPIKLYAEEPSFKIRAATDYFDLPVSLIYAHIVDSIDLVRTDKEVNYNVYPEILNGLHDMFDYGHFDTGHGAFFSALKAEPCKYILPNGDRIIEWLHQLREAGKILFLITSSNIDYASFVLTYCFHEQWKNLFHIKIFNAKKSCFWHLHRPYGLCPAEKMSVEPEKFAIGDNYFGGNCRQLKEFLIKITNKSSPKIVYIGDSVIKDIYAPNHYCDIDTIAIVEELEAEGVFGYEPVCSPSAEAILSNTWGSYFSFDKTDNDETIWTHFIREHAKFMVPSLCVLANYPINHKYKIFGSKTK